MTLLLDEPAAAVRACGVVAVTGPDRLPYLHALLTQDIQDAAAWTAADFLYLDAKGNAVAAGRAVVREDDVLLVVPPETTDALVEGLDAMRFLRKVEVADVSEQWEVASVRGPGSLDVPGAPDEQMRAAADGPVVLVRERTGGVDVLGPPASVEERLDALGLPRADAAAWETWRISAGEPAWGRELVPGRRAQELGLLPTHVHMRKGCYPGQESIAKIYNLGQPRRALCVVEFNDKVEAGDPVDAAGKRGEVTSVAAVGPVWVALALVPLVDGDVPDELDAGGVRGRVRRRVGEGVPQPGAETGTVGATRVLRPRAHG